ncbi:monocarboxylate transporter 9-like isoform X2 [Macrobrachium nipponense]|uniref:monocarboxylate transporter 9-like isoform X2 n=1 Tax=Macrobrachium nipponense TaxID=159736 RepID=UPI0030C88664
MAGGVGWCQQGPLLTFIAFFYILVGFGATTATIGWIISIHSFLWNMVGPFTMPLVTEFGWRRVASVGVLWMSISLVISAYTPSAEFLFFSFSVLNGAGCGLTATAAFNIVPQYFLRRRGIANGIITGGISIGQIFVPPFVRFLQEEYSSKGALLILAAGTLNGLVGICFFHPVAWHKKYTSEEPEVTEADGTDTKSTRDGSSASSRHRRFSSSSENPTRHVTSNAERSSMHASSVSLAAGVSLQSFPDFEKKEEEKKEEEEEEEEEEELPQEPSRRKTSPLDSMIRVVRSLISNMKVMRSRRAFIINLGITFLLTSHVSFCTMLPFTVQAVGHSLQDASYAVSVMGACSLTARLVVNPMTDCAWFNMRMSYMASYAAISCVMLVFPFMTEIMWINVVMGCYGFTVGMNISLNNLVIIKFMGLENLPSVFGASQVFTGIGFLCAGPVTGIIRDVTQSYAVAIWILSFCVFCSFLLWFLMPAAIAYDQRQEAEQNQICAGKSA